MGAIFAFGHVMHGHGTLQRKHGTRHKDVITNSERHTAGTRATPRPSKSEVILSDGCDAREEGCGERKEGCAGLGSVPRVGEGE